MSLSVASNQKLPVVGIGQIRLTAGEGVLTINNILYCKEIPGIILSIGQMMNQLIKVTFCNNRFTISQGGFDFHSFRRNDRWFLVVGNGSHAIDLKPLKANQCNVTGKECDSSLQDLSFLWHQQMGHLSIRNVNQLLKYNAADGINNSYLQNSGICHLCSIAKSKH
ncbi:hypothetical protein O181_078376 [Austropuccinia psidii MF-1]|uniref:GAG-pre-integrase domain-containing protein n=1 Tax=Austropuccinia psidii MF-1 TaxID=1389203 RepID=A0A9Q3ID01_9BASI|nr:hypothetical protein [Austropuccinia psidii MF-1]